MYHGVLRRKASSALERVDVNNDRQPKKTVTCRLTVLGTARIPKGFIPNRKVPPRGGRRELREAIAVTLDIVVVVTVTATSKFLPCPPTMVI